MNRTCNLQPPGLKGAHYVLFPKGLQEDVVIESSLGFPWMPEQGWFLEGSFKANIQELRWEVGPLGKASLEFTSEVPTCTHFPHKLGNRKSIHFILHRGECGKQNTS